jgi:hypothetical protein
MVTLTALYFKSQAHDGVMMMVVVVVLLLLLLMMMMKMMIALFMYLFIFSGDWMV